MNLHVETSRLQERQPPEAKGAHTDFYTIGEMSRTYGVSLRALRFYEDRELMAPVRLGAVRLYDATQRARLQLILKGKKLGFTLTQIREMVASHGGDEAREFEQTLEPDKIVSQIEALERRRSGLEIAIQELRATQARLTAPPQALAG